MKTLADLCRENDWGPGTKLKSTMPNDERIMEITAVGRKFCLGYYTRVKHGQNVEEPTEYLVSTDHLSWEVLPDESQDELIDTALRELRKLEDLFLKVEDEIGSPALDSYLGEAGMVIQAQIQRLREAINDLETQ